MMHEGGFSGEFPRAVMVRQQGPDGEVGGRAESAGMIVPQIDEMIGGARDLGALARKTCRSSIRAPDADQLRFGGRSADISVRPAETAAQKKKKADTGPSHYAVRARRGGGGPRGA